MPYAPGKPCRAPGCPSVVPSGSGAWCDDHKPPDKPRAKDTRPSAHKRGYGVTWRRLRRMVLNRHPLCADPFGIHKERGVVVAAVEVDHIIPLKAGGDNRMNNLRPLCRMCHARRHAANN